MFERVITLSQYFVRTISKNTGDNVSLLSNPSQLSTDAIGLSLHDLRKYGYSPSSNKKYYSDHLNF